MTSSSAQSPTKITFVPRYENDEFLRLTDEACGLKIVVARSRSELAFEIPDSDVLVIGNRAYDEKVAHILRSDAKKLRLIQFSTSGFERSLKFGLPDGVMAAHAPGVKSSSVAEHAMALILADFRQLRPSDSAQGRRSWERQSLNEGCRNLEESVVAIVGFGAVGQDLARKAKAFDAYVIAVGAIGPHPFADEIVNRTQLSEVLPRADVLVLCAPSNEQNRHMIAARQLRTMKPTALLVNVARGELIDEGAAVAALRKGQIRAMAIDVAEVEPLPGTSPLWSLPNVAITPHIAGSGPAGYPRFRLILMENLRRIDAGERLLHPLPGCGIPS